VAAEFLGGCFFCVFLSGVSVGFLCWWLCLFPVGSFFLFFFFFFGMAFFLVLCFVVFFFFFFYLGVFFFFVVFFCFVVGPVNPCTG